LDGWLSADW